jgi:hypothetical protein
MFLDQEEGAMKRLASGVLVLAMAAVYGCTSSGSTGSTVSTVSTGSTESTGTDMSGTTSMTTSSTAPAAGATASTTSGPATTTSTTSTTAPTTSASSTLADAASAVTALAGNPLVTSLTSGSGLSAAQAVAGAGALLGTAQSKLAPADWQKVSAAVPATDSLVSTARSLTGATSFGDMSSASGALSKVGLSSSQVSALVPAVTSYVSSAAGPEVGGLLAGALK